MDSVVTSLLDYYVSVAVILSKGPAEICTVGSW